jgi:hypothetical protein
MDFIYTYFGWLLLLLSVVFIFAYKKITKNPDAITSKFEVKKKLNGTPNDNLNFIEEALNNSRFNNIEFDKDENSFYAETNFSMSSWSENIVVNINSNQNETDLNFKSICSMPLQLFDWGMNKRNFKRFEKELEKLMSTSVS